jgi:hypothetical protein
MYMWQNISSCHCTYFSLCLGRMFSHHCHILWESLRLVECLRMLFLLDLSVLNNPQLMFKVRFLMVLISKLWIDHLICIQLWAISVLLMHFHLRCPHSSVCKFAKNVWVQLARSPLVWFTIPACTLSSDHESVVVDISLQSHRYISGMYRPTSAFPHPLSRVKQQAGYRVNETTCLCHAYYDGFTAIWLLSICFGDGHLISYLNTLPVLQTQSLLGLFIQGSHEHCTVYICLCRYTLGTMLQALFLHGFKSCLFISYHTKWWTRWSGLAYETSSMDTGRNS